MPKAKTYTLHGVTKTVPQWAAQAGLSKHTVWKRLSAGWPIEKALTGSLYERPARGAKAQTNLERELTRTIRLMVREAEKDMVRMAHRLAKSLAFNIDVKGLADALHGPGWVQTS